MKRIASVNLAILSAARSLSGVQTDGLFAPANLPPPKFRDALYNVKGRRAEEIDEAEE
jgi:hypothetical protein